MFKFFHRLGSPKYFYNFSGKLMPWLAVPCVLLFVYGLYAGLIKAPPDYQQGEAYRIIFVHVPAAWMSLFVYVLMAVSAAASFIWRVKFAEITFISCAPIGAAFTFLALITGSLWGRPMWGSYWEWDDPRMTSELLLLFLYFGVIALYGAIEDKHVAARAAAILAMVGVINVIIVHYSVKWWSSIHQGPILEQIDKPSVHPSMFVPLIVMVFAFKFYFGLVLLMRSRNELLQRERNSRWVQELIAS